MVTFVIVTLAFSLSLLVIFLTKRLIPLMISLPNPAEMVVLLTAPWTVSSRARNAMTLYAFILGTDLLNCLVSMSYRIAVLSRSCVGDETGVCDILLEFVGRRMMRLYRILVLYISGTLGNDQLDAQILIYLLQSSTCTCFEQYLAHSQEVRLY